METTDDDTDVSIYQTEDVFVVRFPRPRPDTHALTSGWSESWLRMAHSAENRLL